MRMNRIKKLELYKRVLLCLIFFVVAMRIIYIFIGKQVNKEFVNYDGYNLSSTSFIDCNDLSQEFTCTYDRLYSIQLMFSNVPEDATGTVVLSICAEEDDDELYMTRLSLDDIEDLEWKSVFVNAPVDSDKIYRLTITSWPDCTQVPQIALTKDLCAPEIVTSYQYNQKLDGNIAISYGHFAEVSFFDRFVASSIWIILFLIFSALVININAIFRIFDGILYSIRKTIGKQAFSYTLVLLFAKLIVDCSGIDFQETTKIFIYVISLVSVINLEEKNIFIQSISHGMWERLILVCTYAYASFSLVGQRIFIYPLYKNLSASGIIIYLITTVWSMWVINSLIFYFSKIRMFFLLPEKRLKNTWFLCMIIAILVFPLVYNLYAFNPGITSPDSFHSMIVNAGQLHGMYDWHPFFYCFVLKGLLNIWNSTYIIVIFQYVFYVYIVLELMLYLRKKGIRDSALIIFAMLIGFNPGNVLHINTIWKDIPYSLSLLWVFVIISKLCIDEAIYSKKWYIYLELIVALVGVALYRKNGIATVSVIFVGLIPLIKHNIKLFLSVFICIGVIALIKGPLYRYYEVESAGRRGLYIGLGADMMGAYYSGGEVNESSMKFITKMTDKNVTGYNYNPTCSDATWDSYNIDMDPKEFVIDYIDTFIKNPVLIVRSIIDRNDAIWDIFQGQDTILGCQNYYISIDTYPEWSYLWEEWEKNYPERKYVSIYNQVVSINSYSVGTQWVNAIVWRCGLLTLLGFIGFGILLLLRDDKRVLCIISPIAGQVISLLLSTGWSEYRYYWSLNLMNTAFLMLMFIALDTKDDALLRHAEK